ncbi:MAG: metal ABC transporter substrate-binding protein [Terracoccus sp.]|uniref:metal ABC transporter substrate-binding protein n=1 Tax=Cryobacterium sp. PH31-AA6 TaxID=3046205 RepID=UPI0024BA80AC|nr:metal ABC transporter substrate-binding protein [Cryobacterium sp. PH31-AA6]MDJ0324981.1 metal ABC transporter substrate-binding protein [Cryobacterium sp. PH31-AA6]
MISPKLRLPALLATAALALTGCSAAEPGNGGVSGGLSIVATTTQVADLTRNVVGETSGVTVTQLVKPNQSAHAYDPSAADLTALGHADVLVINGVGLEEWLGDAIDASGFDGVTIDSSTGITLAADAAANDESTHSSEPAAGNPHIWTDVANAEAMVRTIEKGLSAASPVNSAAFAADAAAYEARLAALDGWIRSNIDQVPADERLLVSNHDAFGYFTTAYGITYVGSVIPSFDDNAEPSAAAIDRLVAAIKATGVQAVFSEASINPKAADTIAKQAGVEVYSGEDALYGDSLGPAGSDGATYLASQVHNVSLVLRSWGVTPATLPPELR